MTPAATVRVAIAVACTLYAGGWVVLLVLADAAVPGSASDAEGLSGRLVLVLGVVGAPAALMLGALVAHHPVVRSSLLGVALVTATGLALVTALAGGFLLLPSVAMVLVAFVLSIMSPGPRNNRA